MFIIKEKSVDFSTLKETLVSVLRSINEPKIAAAEHSPQATQGFVITSQFKRKFETHIVLHLSQENEDVVYAWEEGAYDPSRKSEIEEAALDFVEGMGFMMDNMNWGKRSPVEKSMALDEIPMFRVIPDEPVSAEILPEENAETKPVYKSQAASSETVIRLDSLFDEKSINVVESSGSFEMFEDDFQRSPQNLGDEVDSIFDGFDQSSSISASMGEVSKPEKPRENSTLGGERFRALMKLMSSF